MHDAFPQRVNTEPGATCPINSPHYIVRYIWAVADPGGVQGVQTPALLFRCHFFEKNIFFENMLLRFLAEQGAS